MLCCCSSPLLTIFIFFLDCPPVMSQKPANPFHKLPVEVICKIYANLDRLRYCRHAAATCKQARAILHLNEPLIAREWLQMVLPRSYWRLGVMTIASANYGKSTAGDFIEAYMSSEREFPEPHYGLSDVANLKRFVDDVEGVMEMKVCVDMMGFAESSPSGSNFYSGRFPNGSATGSKTELLRAMRACLMIEIARNLFYNSDGDEDPAKTAAAEGRQEVDWHKKYWTSFSSIEVNSASLMADCYETILFNTFKNCAMENSFVTGREEDYEYFCSNNPGARIFSLKTGLARLRDWHYAILEYHSTRNDTRKKIPKAVLKGDPHTACPEFIQLVRGGNYYDPFENLLKDEETQFAETSFHPDPKAIDQATWNTILTLWRGKRIEKYYDQEDDKVYFTCQGLWDDSTLQRWEAQDEDDKSWRPQGEPEDDVEVGDFDSEFSSGYEDEDTFKTPKQYERSLDLREELYPIWKEEWACDVSYRDFASTQRYERKLARSGMGLDDGWIPSSDDEADDEEEEDEREEENEEDNEENNEEDDEEANEEENEKDNKEDNKE
ncbi:uncharacterized protein F4812DRAFT_416063 [Daldinia caldariorum]|uniref:uncharacterized protein n=1 Tax=Daldinia caldariorum TaxID=326644 RepID=UPI0020072D5C|nr:uncharacterized protein F4812DRAFT_416063 [Daldinia caldariorum]KAI1471929.1 hypothetical protein F4812DRAFT_416063 [Daldinia caldariorum]